jgi:hypothetical protein
MDRNFKAGQVIQKRAKDGSVRCECVANGDGTFTYNGRTYASLSAAGLVASRDLGLNNVSCNGYVFWQTEAPGKSPNARKMRVVPVEPTAAETLAAAEQCLKTARESVDAWTAVVNAAKIKVAEEAKIEEAKLEEEERALEAKLAEIKARKGAKVTA